MKIYLGKLPNICDFITLNRTYPKSLKNLIHMLELHVEKKVETTTILPLLPQVMTVGVAYLSNPNLLVTYY